MYIGIDIGGMSIKAGIVNENGDILAKHAVETPLTNNEDFLNAMLKASEAAMEKANVKKEDIKAVGIGAPGACDREKSVLIEATNIPYKNASAGDFFKEKLGDIPVLVDNDANCAALGEFYKAENVSDFVFITLGTGIGGGIIIDKKLFVGSNGIGAELGHIVTHSGGRKCGCGRKGCWEAYASVTGLINLTRENRHLIKSISPDEEISGRTVFEYAKKGDEEARRVRDEWIEEVAIGITDMVNIFQPDRIVVGGAISKEGDVIMKPIRKYVEENCYKAEGVKIPDVVASKIGGDAGIIGAAFLYRNKND